MQEYLGVLYPIVKTSQGFLINGTDDQQIKASLLTIILTNPGDRVFELEFGVPLNQLAKENDMVIEEKSRMMIASAIEKWEKRVQVHNIATKVQVHEATYLYITVSYYTGQDLKRLQQLNLATPLGE